jgi:hypothetical protein
MNQDRLEEGCASYGISILLDSSEGAHVEPEVTRSTSQDDRKNLIHQALAMQRESCRPFSGLLMRISKLWDTRSRDVQDEVSSPHVVSKTKDNCKTLHRASFQRIATSMTPLRLLYKLVCIQALPKEASRSLQYMRRLNLITSADFLADIHM